MIKKGYSTCIAIEKEHTSYICPRCLADSIEHWANKKYLANRNKELKKLVLYIDNFLNENSKLESSALFCQSCERKSAYISPQSFSNIVEKKMIELDVNKKDVEEFKDIFCFN
ncbi:MAG: hypothetical protein WC781_00735 [Candidatus Pacearchaeota archaeon]|jgi:hypothetical protein